MATIYCGSRREPLPLQADSSGKRFTLGGLQNLGTESHFSVNPIFHWVLGVAWRHQQGREQESRGQELRGAGRPAAAKWQSSR